MKKPTSVINKRTILLPSVLGTQTRGPHGKRGALHHRCPLGCGGPTSPTPLRQPPGSGRCPATPVALSTAPLWLHPWVHPLPAPTHLPMAWIWEHGHHRRVPAVAPRSKGSPQSTAGPRASGWGTAGEFLLDDCASWPAVRWGPGQENRTGARSAAKPLAEPGCFPAAPAPRGRGPRGADYVAKGKAFPQCCKAHISQGCIAARPPPRLPRAVCLAAGSTFIS